MVVEKTPLKDCLILTPPIHNDNRGFFYEQFNQNTMNEYIETEFIPRQDNVSFSRYGVIRGLHAQKENFAQAKIVSVLQGKVLDVAVDIRLKSPTFGKSFSVILSSENHKQLFIPRGFLHGFSTLSESALFFYKCDNFFHGPSGFGVRFDDPELQIDWQLPKGQEILSEKDAKLPHLKDLTL